MLMFIYFNELGRAFHFDHELKSPELDDYADALGPLTFKGTTYVTLGA